MTTTNAHYGLHEHAAPIQRNARPLGLLSRRGDARTLIWSLGLFPLPALIAFFRPAIWAWVFPLALYLGFCAGVLSHYHNHRSVFRSRVIGALYSNYLGIFYGFPLFGWIPTHNQNHHKYVDGDGDDTRTEKAGRDSLLTAILYPWLSSRWQLPALAQYLKKSASKSGYKALEPYVQLATLLTAHASLALVLISRHGAQQGGLAYATLLLVPALFSSWAMMFTNYLQHVGCDPTSPDNHSRNFVGAWENWLVFDAGLHTVHHEHPGVHFSEYRRLHEERAERIAPELNERNMLTFIFRRYVLGKRAAPKD